MIKITCEECKYDTVVLTEEQLQDVLKFNGEEMLFPWGDVEPSFDDNLYVEIDKYDEGSAWISKDTFDSLKYEYGSKAKKKVVQRVTRKDVRFGEEFSHSSNMATCYTAVRPNHYWNDGNGMRLPCVDKEFRLQWTDSYAPVYVRREIDVLAGLKEVFSEYGKAFHAFKHTIKCEVDSSVTLNQLQQLKEKYPECTDIRVLAGGPHIVGVWVDGVGKDA